MSVAPSSAITPSIGFFMSSIFIEGKHSVFFKTRADEFHLSQFYKAQIHKFEA
jgi:hypothetical protein